MTAENWIKILVPVIGVIVAAISAGFTYLFAKRQQLNADENRLKEKYYLDFIQAVSNSVVSNHADKARDQLSDAINQLLLIGSPLVVKNLMLFHDCIKPSNSENFTLLEHDRLLTELIKSMRTDLYKSLKVNKGYPIIHLTGKAPADKRAKN